MMSGQIKRPPTAMTHKNNRDHVQSYKERDRQRGIKQITIRIPEHEEQAIRALAKRKVDKHIKSLEEDAK